MSTMTAVLTPQEIMGIELDRQVYRHLILDEAAPEWTVWLQRRARRQHLVTATVLPPNSPSYPPINIPLHAPDHNLSLTRILDILVDDYDKNEFPSFPSLDVVRAIGGGSRYAPIPKCRTVMVYPCRCAEEAIKGQPVRIRPSDIHRLVIPVDFPYNTDCPAMRRISWHGAGEVEELVLYFNDGDVDTDSLHELVGELVRFLGSPFPSAAVAATFKRIVIVGADSEGFINEWVAAMNRFKSWGGKIDGFVSALDKFYFYDKEEYNKMQGLAGDDTWITL